MYVDDLVTWGKSEDDLRELVGRFGEVRKRRGMKIHVKKREQVDGVRWRGGLHVLLGP